MNIRFAFLALAGSVLCSCNNNVVNYKYSYNEEWSENDDAQSFNFMNAAYQAKDIHKSDNVCFYIEDSIAVIAPGVDNSMGMQAIMAGFYQGDVVIPATVTWEGKTYPVRRIGNSAFTASYMVNSITIPEGVKEIEDGAIYSSGVKVISLPSTVEKLTVGSIGSCESLSELRISPKNKSFESVEGCAVIIDKKTGTLIKAFSLNNIPASVKVIASGALNGVKAESLYISAGLTCIEPNAFTGSNIGSITIDPANPVYDSTPGLNCFVEKATGRLITGASSLTTIPENVVEICNDAFNGIALGDSIILNDKLKRIGDRAFFGHRFTSIRIPAALREIGDNAFSQEEFGEGSRLQYVSADPKNRRFKSPQGSNVLIRKSDATLVMGCANSVIPQKGVKSIGYKAFQGCAIKSVTLPEGLVSVGDSAFLDCGVLSELQLPKSLKILGNSAFQRCQMLRKVDLPEGLLVLGDNAFCVTSIDTIVIPKGLEIIGDNALSMTQLQQVIIPEGVKKIGNHAFTFDPLTSVILPQSLEVIGDNAFSDCRGLKTAELPQSVRYIGKRAFDYTQIDHVTFGPALEYIGSDAFNACSNINYVFIPASVKKIGTGAFSSCQLDSIKVHEGNERYYSNGCNVLVDRTNGTLINGSTSAFIPDGVKIIGRQAFYTIDLKNIQIPEGVEEIGESAFWGCSNAETLQLPSTLKTIGNYTFCHCASIGSVNLPAGIGKISQSMFLGCTSLEDIVIPEGVTEICPYAFQGCTGLKSITIPASVTSIGAQAFQDCWQLKDIRNYSSIAIEPVEMPQPAFNYGRRSMAAGFLDAMMNLN